MKTQRNMLKIHSNLRTCRIIRSHFNRRLKQTSLLYYGQYVVERSRWPCLWLVQTGLGMFGTQHQLFENHQVFHHFPIEKPLITFVSPCFHLQCKAPKHLLGPQTPRIQFEFQHVAVLWIHKTDITMRAVIWGSLTYRSPQVAICMCYIFKYSPIHSNLTGCHIFSFGPSQNCWFFS